VHVFFKENIYLSVYARMLFPIKPFNVRAWYL